MANFFDRMLGRQPKAGSSEVARNRLQLVLVHDRISLPPERLRELKEELLAVIARYVPVDSGTVDISLVQPDRNSSKIIAEIPFGKGMIQLEGGLHDYTEDDDLGPDTDTDKDADDDEPPAPLPDSASEADSGADEARDRDRDHDAKETPGHA